MNNSNILKENLMPDYFSGNLKFSTDYISKIQLVQACKDISDKYPEFIQFRVRNGGSGDLAVDLLFDSKDLTKEDHRAAGVNYFRDIFKEFLGQDYIKSYDLGNRTIIVK